MRTKTSKSETGKSTGPEFFILLHRLDLHVTPKVTQTMTDGAPETLKVWTPSRPSLSSTQTVGLSDPNDDVLTRL